MVTLYTMQEWADMSAAAKSTLRRILVDVGADPNVTFAAAIGPREVVVWETDRTVNEHGDMNYRVRVLPRIPAAVC